MGYYIMLSLQYMRQNLVRTFYSFLGVLLTFVLVFAVITTCYSYLRYCLEMCYKDWGGEFQLYSYNAEEFMTPDTVQAMEGDAAVQGITLYDMDSAAAITAEELTEKTKFELLVSLKDTSNLRKSAEELNRKYDSKLNVSEDIELFLNQGDSLERSLLNTIIVLLGSVFGVFSMVVLRNTMMISVVERMRDYGLLRCVGMSKKQLYILLMTEGILVGLCAAMGGMGVGFGFLKGIEGWVNAFLKLPVEFHFYFYPRAVIITALLCLAVTLFSLIEPGRQAGNISPMEAIHRNVVLRNRRGGVREKIGYHSGKIIGKLLGVSGEYAYKNMMRSRGRFVYLFCGVFICITLLASVCSFTDSLYATIDRVFYGKKTAYPEEIDFYPEVFLEEIDPAGIEHGYDSYNGCDSYSYCENKLEEIKQICSDIREMNGVEKVAELPRIRYESFQDEKLKKSNQDKKVDDIYQRGYDEEDLNGLKPYLIEGEIDFQRLEKEKGVILFDTYYNEKEYGSDGKIVHERLTDYQVGDTITLLSPSMWEKARNLYDDAVDKAIRGKKWKHLKEVYGRGDEGFDELCDRVLKLLKKQGYDCSKIRSSSEYQILGDIITDLQEILYQRGETVSYTIQGIVSEDILYGGGMEEGVAGGGKRVTLFSAENVVIDAMEESMKEALKDGCDGWFTFAFMFELSIGVRRNIGNLDNTLMEYCLQNSTEEVFLQYDSEVEEYIQMLSTLRTVRFVANIIGGFILLITLVQIFNIVRANMSLRRKELWLYEVVGMSRRQERRMVVLENSAAVLMAIVFGLLASRGLTWYIVSYLLDQMGMFRYIYPLGKNLLLSGGILVLSILICLLGHGRRRKLIQ